MEFEDMSERIEWEARRVAAAFGLQEYEKRREEDWLCAYVGWMNQTQIWWNIDARTQEFFYIHTRVLLHRSRRGRMRDQLFAKLE